MTSESMMICSFLDPIKTARGFLSVKVYRLTPEAIAVVQERDYTPETLRNMKLGFENMLQEVKVVIKNSHLVNTLLCELYEVVYAFFFYYCNFFCCPKGHGYVMGLHLNVLYFCFFFTYMYSPFFCDKYLYLYFCIC